MNAGFKPADGSRVDVQSDSGARRVLVEVAVKFADTRDEHPLEPFHGVGCLKLTAAEARAISSALMGAAAEL
jgi:hypothetical protein